MRTLVVLEQRTVALDELLRSTGTILVVDPLRRVLQLASQGPPHDSVPDARQSYGFLHLQKVQGP